MAKVIGIDLGTTNSVVAVVEGGEPTVIPNQEGSRLDAVGGRLHQGRREPGRAGRQAPGHHQPGEHRLLHQALHGPAVRRGPARRSSWSRTRSSKAANGDVRVEIRGKQYSPPEISAMILRKLKEAAEELPGREGHPGGDHGARLLQRQPAAGHQGRRQDRRPRRAPHHQRADRGRAGLRARQEEGRDDRRLRPRRRHLRHLDPRDRRGRLRGQGHQRRHPPRRRRLRPAHHRLDRRRVQARSTASTCARTAWRSSGSRKRPRRRRSSCRSTVQTEINLPFITADASGPKHLVHDAHRGPSSRRSSADLIERTSARAGRR